MKKIIPAVLCALLLCGCATIAPDRAVSIGNPAQDLTATTQLPITYQEAYTRALRWAHDCHDISRNHQYSATIEANIDNAARTAMVHVKRAALQGGVDFERLDFTATPTGTAMTITVNNTRWWGKPELQAAEASVKSGTTQCHWMFDQGEQS